MFQTALSAAFKRSISVSTASRATTRRPPRPYPGADMFRTIRLLALAAIVLVPTAASAGRMVYSYDSATPLTRKMTENGLTFVFDKNLMSTRILKIIETQDVGEAELKPA